VYLGIMNWSELSTVLKRCGGIALEPLSLQTSAVSVEWFPVVATAVAPPAPITTAVEIPKPVIVVETPKPVAVVVNTVVETTEAPRVRKPLSSKHAIDPVVLGLELNEPLYEGAPSATRRVIECEGAQKLEGALDSLYKSAAGRSRGWTKVGLEGFLKPRCASGGDLHLLDRAKKGFLWSLATEDKALSAFLDFVCCARHIRCVLWNFEKKTVHLYPAADDHSDATTGFPLLHVDTGGHLVHGISSTSELLTYVDREGWILLPPASVTHSLNGLTLDELESVGKKLGMSAVEGKKADRITAIATFKTRARLV
jgi:hypothetical protein